MRLFIALPVLDQARDQLAALQRQLAQADLPVRWVRPEGIHLTLVFLGEVAEERVPLISRVMDEATTGLEPIAAGIAGLGTFPKRGAPRVLWAGLTGDLDRLAELQARLAAGLRGAGFPLEDRPFHPHVTLGRSKGTWSEAHLAAWRRAALPDAGSWRAGEVHLMRSQLHPQGSRYTAVYTSVLRQFGAGPSGAEPSGGR